MARTTSPEVLKFRISGLHCEGCVDTSLRVLEAVAGVRSARVELASGRTEVEVEPAFDDSVALDRAIAEAGYTTDLLGEEPAENAKAESPKPPEEAPIIDARPIGEIRLRIEGMSCASCVAKVQKAIEGVEGVAGAEVNFATNRAAVKAQGEVKEAMLLGAVKAAGYGAELLSARDEEADPAATFEAERRRAEAEIEGWRWQALGAGAASLWLLALGPVAGLAWVHALVATAVQALAGRRYYKGAWRALKARSANMDSLIVLSTTSAWGFGAWLLIRGAPSAREFMTATLLLTFVSLGKWLEGRGRMRAGRALRALLELAPARAHRIENGESVDVDSRDLKPADRCRVLQGERVPTDGRLEQGKAEIDEAMLTGESTPVLKSEGESLFGGTVNVSAPLTMIVEKVGSATALRQIVRRVEEAQNTRPKIQGLVDQVASVFVPVVLLVAAVTLGLSLAAGLPGGEALMRAVAVLIVACPCALGLATPLAVMAGVGVAARRGIILRSAEELEISSKLQWVIFDKTGTLTEGAPEVTALAAAPGVQESELLEAAASLEAENTHPLAVAIVAAARSRGISPKPATGVEAVIGRGVRSIEPPFILGSREYLRSESVDFTDFDEELLARQRNGETLIAVGRLGGRYLGAIALADRIKEGSARAIADLHRLGLKTALLSGDAEPTTRAVARELGIDEFRARVKPEGKADVVKELQAAGTTVAMVGDGINDAPALAQADLGVAVASGSDIAQEAAGIVLLSGDPRQVSAAIGLARRIRAKMIQNLGWAFVYNLVLIPVAAFGLLQPIYASMAMAFSSVSVVGNALLLYRSR